MEPAVPLWQVSATAGKCPVFDQAQFIATSRQGTEFGLVGEFPDQENAHATEFAFSQRSFQVRSFDISGVEGFCRIADQDDDRVSIPFHLNVHGAVAAVVSMQDDVGDCLVNNQAQVAQRVTFDAQPIPRPFDERTGLLEVLQVASIEYSKTWVMY